MAHLSLTKAEHDTICSVMDCQKLTLEPVSLEPCTHVDQNQRLALRMVEQVFFSAKIRMQMSEM